MRHQLLLLGLALTTPVFAQDQPDKPNQPEKPFLVLDTGGHTQWVLKIIFSANAKELFTVSQDNTVRVWDVASGQLLRVLRLPPGADGMARLHTAALSPDGKTLAVGGFADAARKDSPIYLVSLASGGIERVLRGHTGGIFALAFTPDGKQLASGSVDKTIRLWTVATGQCVQTLEGHTDTVRNIAFAPDGRRLASASLDSTARIWSLANGKSEAVLKDHRDRVNDIAWSPDGKTLATGSYDQSIRLWNADGTAGRSFEKLGNKVMALKFTPDSRELLFIRGNQGPKVCSMLTLATRTERVRFTHNNTVQSGTLSADGSLAATSGGHDNETFIWRTADGSVVSKLVGKGQGLCAAGWSTDGARVAWGTDHKAKQTQGANPLERTFRPADLEFGPAPDGTFRRARLTLGPVSLEKTDSITMSIRRDGKVAATYQTTKFDLLQCFTLLNGDRTAVGSAYALTLVDSRTGKPIQALLGHSGDVFEVSPAPDGRYLLSSGQDQTLRVWSIERDAKLLLIFFFAGNDWLISTPEGYYAASPGGERLMGWLVGKGPDQMPSYYPAAQFRKSLYRPDVISRVLAAGSVEKALAQADKARGQASQPADLSKLLPPKVAITSPARSGQRAAKAEIEVQATASSVGAHPVTALSLLVDGRPYQGQRAVKKVAAPKLGETSESWTVQLDPGKHRLQVLADSAVSQGQSETVEVLYLEEVQAEVELPSLYVLAVGVAAYPAEALKLNYSARDAEAIAKVLQEKGKPLFKKVEAKVLTDKEASRADILKGLGWVRKEMTSKDYAIVFFSGHGDKDADGSLYFLPYDVDVADLPTTGVPGDQFKKLLVGLPGKVVALLDACHSGGIDGGKRKGSASLTDDLVRDLVTEENGLIVMCSSTGREFSLENNEYRHSNFTQALIEGLSGKAARTGDAAVYLHQLDSYVTDRVKQLSQGRQHPVTAKPSTIRSFPLAKP